MNPFLLVVEENAMDNNSLHCSLHFCLREEVCSQG